MKSRLLLVVAIMLVAVVLLFRAPLRELAVEWRTRDMFTETDRDDFNPGPALGSRFPGLRALAGSRGVALIEEYAGPAGTVLVVLDSLERSPYCRRQLLQLEAYRDDFASAGIGLVAISADSPEFLRAFAVHEGIGVPLLADDQGLSVRTLGLVDYGKAAPAFPGSLVIDPDGTVVGKLFIADPRRRVDAAATLRFAALQLGH